MGVIKVAAVCKHSGAALDYTTASLCFGGVITQEALIISLLLAAARIAQGLPLELN